MRSIFRSTLLLAFAAGIAALSMARACIGGVRSEKISELTPTATLHLGKTADWVVSTDDAVWIGSTGPFAVHRIDPQTNRRIATVRLPGEPCAGLATGFGSLWIPLCAKPNRLAKVDLASNRLTRVFTIGPAAAEGGITTGAGSVWLVLDDQGSLARIDPGTGTVQQTIRLPPGSYNPLYADGRVWVTHAAGSDITSVDAAAGILLATIPTGPGPRFLTVGEGAVWTLNQGDGSLTRIDLSNLAAVRSVDLRTPGHGGDINHGAGMIWTTMPKAPLSLVDAASATLKCRWTGPGGDSLTVGHGALWLTDYHRGTVSRIELARVLANCP